MKSGLLQQFWTGYYWLFFPKTYSSIYDTPIRIWVKVQDTKDLSLLLKDDIKIPFEKLNQKKIIDSFENIYSEFIEAFPPKEYIENLELRKKIALMRYKAVRYNQRHLNTLAALEELKLTKSNQNTTKVDIKKNIVIIERQQNVKLSYLKMTIFEYYNYVEALSE